MENVHFWSWWCFLMPLLIFAQRFSPLHYVYHMCFKVKSQFSAPHNRSYCMFEFTVHVSENLKVSSHCKTWFHAFLKLFGLLKVKVILLYKIDSTKSIKQDVIDCEIYWSDTHIFSLLPLIVSVYIIGMLCCQIYASYI